MIAFDDEEQVSETLYPLTVVDLMTCTITGTDGRDVLRGTGGDDVICGFGGDDILIGFSGDDLLIGGAGRDTLLGGWGETSSWEVPGVT